jgi:hypothetical protein
MLCLIMRQDNRLKISNQKTAFFRQALEPFISLSYFNIIIFSLSCFNNELRKGSENAVF